MSLSRRVVAALGVAAAAGASSLALLPAQASSPSDQTLTTPSKAGRTAEVKWTGTVPVGANPDQPCATPGTADEHTVTLRVPEKAVRLTRELTFAVRWTPGVAAAANDLIMVVVDPTGATTDVGDRRGSSVEKVVVRSPMPGPWRLLVCGYANVSDQAYRGTATLEVSKPVIEKDLPTIATGLAFGPSTPSDIQRNIGEPAVTTDRAGNIYTCGPSGFANIADFANVSTDGGDQFHLIGQPPRGQISLGEGGGDCALATGVTKNASGHYALAYAGLGPLTNFSTFSSADAGRTLLASPISESVPGVDRQWIAFLDDKLAFFTYNQQATAGLSGTTPEAGGAKVVQTSTDAGLTYGPAVPVAFESGRIGQIRAFTPPGKKTATQGVVYFPYSNGSSLKLGLSRDSGRTWTTCVLGKGEGAIDAGFVGADNDDQGNIYGVWSERGAGHDVYLVTLPAKRFSTCIDGKTAASNAPVRVNREGIHTTVMPWVAASGVPGRVAVAWYGTKSVGDPNLGAFKATWNVYVAQSVDALSKDPHWDQVKAATYPFHYDSICLNGLGCDLSVPAGDRSLVDYFTMEYNRGTGRLTIVYSAPGKRPGELEGHVSQPTVLVQSGGPSNGGGSVSPLRPVVALGSDDPSGDALSQYSSLFTHPLPTVNSDALDLRSVQVKPTQRDFTVTLKVADLSEAALQQAMQDNTAQELVWMFRWRNGYQPVAVTVHWSPATGFRAGYDGYTTNELAAGRGVSGLLQLYPGATPLPDLWRIDQEAGTITVRVPGSLLRGLEGPSGDGLRPHEVKAHAGTRFYEGYAAALANVAVSTGQGQTETYLYPADNAPTFDFKLRP